jgi:hypothetical protein
MHHGLYAVFRATLGLVSSACYADAQTFQSEHYRLRVATAASGLVKRWDGGGAGKIGCSGEYALGWRVV